ncbi:aldolase [Halobacillus sp. BBL2006]|uniref:aldolase n=1 Tax=Halobacillus sp. BBL2006 TaxID=1543706 RepID=UPI0005432DE6|nr:aldolase [Halobacillus sp. BBL2006]KHE69230.1 aldolase [Halobacillus sp. BBL2006]
MTTKKDYSYNAFGLNISSETSLLELIPSTKSNLMPDLKIRKKNLDPEWSYSTISNDQVFVKKNMLMFKVSGVATYLIENGGYIYFHPTEKTNFDQVRIYILGTCMGAILLQRKILPLHGSAIAIDGKAYAIVGDSGAGKSTLASAFLDKGYQLLSDDVIPVSFSEEGIPIVTPAYPQQKLWQESMDQFGIESCNYQPIFNRETKFKVPVAEKFCDESLALAGIIELKKSEGNQIKFEPIENLHRLSTLYKHTYRNFIIPRAGLTEWHFQTSAKIISKIEMHKLQRPISTFTAHKLTDVILSTIRKEEEVI